MHSLHWVSKPNQVNAKGNTFGYHTMNEHYYSRIFRQTELIEDDNSKHCIMLTTPHKYEPIPNKINWLYTMWEGLDVSEEDKKSILKADYLFTPSHWVKSVFASFFDPDKIFVINHGLDKFYYYKKRKPHSKKPFRFLWVGAANPRKGWEELIYVWKAANLDRNSKIELYIKTTDIKLSGVNQLTNVILDSRKLSKKKLRDLYHSANCFLFPTRGEGFGLTLLEAMATGLPCIATNFSGHLDYFNNSNGYLIDYEIKPTKVLHPDTREVIAETDVAFPNIEHFLKLMIEIVSNYKKALEKGRKAAKDVRQLSWKEETKKMAQIIIDHY